MTEHRLEGPDVIRSCSSTFLTGSEVRSRPSKNVFSMTWLGAGPRRWAGM